MNAPDERLPRAIRCLEGGDAAGAAALARELLAEGPDQAAWHVLGIACTQRGELDDAEAAFAAALELAPDDPQTLANAALLAERRGRSADAAALFERVLAVDPGERTALSWIGARAQEGGNLDRAQWAFTRCLEAHPGFAAGWCNLGGLCVARGRLDAAERAYAHAIALEPELDGGHQGLVWVHTTRGDEAARVAAVRAWAAARPAHPVAAHLAGALTPATPPARCSPAFVAALFDDFARDYDRVLANLDTRVAKTLASLWERAGVQARTVLDLGCGTGSASAWLRAPGRRLVGVDLSPRMLQRAHVLGVHDELHQDDALAFLAATEQRFDAVVLADVAPYFGDLAPLLGAVASRLANGGHVLLSCELSPVGRLHLAPTGRFQHAASDLEAAGCAHGLALVAFERGPLRREGGADVPGLCVLLRAEAAR